MSTLARRENTNTMDSPKTPGGISKSLLTPCRRIGLSRKFNRKSVSPFISPLPSKMNSTEMLVKTESKKRKLCTSDEENGTVNDSNEIAINKKESGICKTPTPSKSTSLRNVSKKKSLLMNEAKEKEIKSDHINDSTTLENDIRSQTESEQEKIFDDKKPKTIAEPEAFTSKINGDSKIAFNQPKNEKSPNNLAKECVVVIQKKILKTNDYVKQCNYKSNSNQIKNNMLQSQSVFDSDSDDVPLCELNKNNNTASTKSSILQNNIANKGSKVKENRKKISSPIQKIQLKAKKESVKNKTPVIHLDDDDDDFVSERKTILIRKSYNKIVKPSKAKSTGSVTQKDIEELKARIEMKKRQLIAEAMIEETEELRTLIKKWKKGCQNALAELCDVMKAKFPDNRNMGYSEILKNLNIPPELVGYDVDNDCFVTPEDSSIILSAINT